MKTESNTKTHPQTEKTPSTKALIYGDLLNVTWRMLVPTLIGIGLGMMIDDWLEWSPFGFLIGALLGFIAGLWLAFRLLNYVRSQQ